MIQVDFSKHDKSFKQINGICCMDTENPDNFFSYRFPICRLHDQDDGRFVVDIAQIFPNFNADEQSEDSYDFRATDEIITALVSHGTQVIYRLGNTIDHSKYPRWSEVPADYAKWARICEHIIAHYNKGWKDGYSYGIKYWEIWNEPDLICLNLFTMWQGTQEEYFKLYQEASVYLKKSYPEILIGGYAAARSRAPFFENFLQFVRANQLPLDFFSWHRYGSELEKLEFQAKRVRRMLDDYGLTNTISVLDEFNYAENSWFGNNAWNVYGRNPVLMESFFSRMRNHVGASYLTAAKIMLLDLPVDIACFYDGQHGHFGSLYDFWGNDSKSAKATRAFSNLVEGTRVEAVSDVQDVFIAASIRENRADILISCFECKGREQELLLHLIDGFHKARVFLINDYFSGECIKEYDIDRIDFGIPISIRPYNVIHVVLC